MWNKGKFLIPTEALLADMRDAPLPIGEIHAGLADPLSAFALAERFIAFSPIANITGLPAISLPTHVIDGLPVGVQLVGRPGGEHVLLALGAQLERRFRWQRRHPSVW